MGELTGRDPHLGERIPESCSLLRAEDPAGEGHLHREGSCQTLFKIFKVIIIPITS